MIDESRQHSHSRFGRSKRFRKSHALLSLATALGLVFGGLVLATPGQADQEAESIEESGNGRVCDGLDSGKIDTPDGPTSVTISAPEGYVIIEYCVKAGPEAKYHDVDRLPSDQIFGTDDKDISHYSFAYEEVQPDESGDLKLEKTLDSPVNYAGSFTIEYSCSLENAEPITGSVEIAAGLARGRA